MYIYKYVEESYFHCCNNTHGVGTAIFYNAYIYKREHMCTYFPTTVQTKYNFTDVL